MDVGAWLRGLGLGRYEQAFRDNEIDAEVLAELTADDLRELGLPARAAASGSTAIRGPGRAADRRPPEMARAEAGPPHGHIRRPSAGSSR